MCQKGTRQSYCYFWNEGTLQEETMPGCEVNHVGHVEFVPIQLKSTAQPPDTYMRCLNEKVKFPSYHYHIYN